ncbi:hypothetical protein RND71_022709 [Anisodus tanguticus]|uniref:Uncharacterized protein n=1 Tax=Anisodus tanguticus TaxID=243964 RepID=A0AAE1VD71_9SOLA|nr:hypothetical protein RND71_022709 [Anisodus tanguticus]
MPPTTEQIPIIIEDDDEVTDEEPLAKRQKTSTPLPSSQPAHTLGKKILIAFSVRPEPLQDRTEDQEKVWHYQEQKEDFNAEIDCLTTELTILDAERTDEQAVIKQNFERDLKMSQDQVHQVTLTIKQLRTELEAASWANTEISTQLNQTLTERDQALADVEAEVARTMLKIKHITWNIRRFTLEKACEEIPDLDAKIFEAKVVEVEAFCRLNGDSIEEDYENSESKSD